MQRHCKRHARQPTPIKECSLHTKLTTSSSSMPNSKQRFSNSASAAGREQRRKRERETWRCVRREMPQSRENALKERRAREMERWREGVAVVVPQLKRSPRASKRRSRLTWMTGMRFLVSLKLSRLRSAAAEGCNAFISIFFSKSL